MNESIAPGAVTVTAEFAALHQHAQQARQWRLEDLFRQNPDRFPRFTLEAAGLFLDYSKNHLDDQTMRLLADVARARGVETLREAMLAGQAVNLTEQRPALHTLLRAPLDQPFLLAGRNLMDEVGDTLARMTDFATRVREGRWTGAEGRRITDVVNIGIGGSDLGPAMSCAALRTFAHPALKLHFLSNVDPNAQQAVLDPLDPATTLFIIASKTFTTQETMLNAHAARAWFLQRADAVQLPKHFVAVSANGEAVADFGIAPSNWFPFWDWVGGRYSLWSAIGLPLMIAVGPEHFRAFLAGAHAMDTHFQTAPLERNMPALLGMIGFWYRECFGTASQLIAPYDQDLHLFPAYLQQLEMESNGKRIKRDGQPVGTRTAPVIWGTAGTNGQHAYFQLLHQGTDLIPVDFIATLTPRQAPESQHTVLLAHCFAQAEALMQGKRTSDDGQALPPHRCLPGNRPSNMLLMDALTPATLGALIALYEHKTFVQGALWQINSFDQWGVELGKRLADRIRSELDGAAAVHPHDSSTAGLIARARTRQT